MSTLEKEEVLLLKTLVLYFTRTGNSKRIAQKISDRADAEIAEISDDKNWQGVWGFIKGGYHSSIWKTTNSRLTPALDLGVYNKVVVISPMWASNVAPAVFSLLLKEKDNIKELHLLIKSDGAPADASFAKIEEKVCKPDFKYSIVTRLDNEEAVVNQIVQALQA